MKSLYLDEAMRSMLLASNRLPTWKVTGAIGRRNCGCHASQASRIPPFTSPDSADHRGYLRDGELELEGKARGGLPVLLDLGATEILVHWGARFNQDQRIVDTDYFSADRSAAEEFDPLPAIKERIGG